MRHRKRTFKLNRTGSHRRCLVANQLKSLIEHGRIETTTAKAKLLTRYADRMITMAKKGDLAARRRAAAELMLRYNPLTSKEARQARQGDQSAYNADRHLLKKLFEELGPRFAGRNGGYTRIVRTNTRTGDAAQRCVIEYVA